MKLLISIILTVILASCMELNSDKLSNNVMIVSHPIGIKNKIIKIVDTTATIRFSMDFWHYFISSHPRISMTIFSTHLYKEHYPYYELGDTSFAYFDLEDHFESFAPMFADTAGGIERQDLEFRGTVWRKDRAGEELPYQPIAQTVSKDVALEFSSFKHIVSDTGSHYIIIYNKRVLHQ